MIRAIEIVVPKLVALVLAAIVGIILDGGIHLAQPFGQHSITGSFWWDWLAITIGSFIGLLWERGTRNVTLG